MNIDILKTDIQDLDISVRAFNAIRSFGWRYGVGPQIKTIGDLIELSPEDFSQVRNCGPVTMMEIKVALAKRGLSLKEKSLNEYQINLNEIAVEIASIQQSLDKLKTKFIFLTVNHEYQKIPTSTQE